MKPPAIRRRNPGRATCFRWVFRLPGFGAAILAFATGLHGDGKYEDRPMGISAEQTAVLNRYRTQARESLPYFDEQFKKPDGRGFFVVTRIYQGEFYEQVFVKVESKEGDSYKGRIASKPMGRVKFAHGDKRTVPASEVTDWTIILPTGEEIGNLTGKALEALQAHAVVFIIGMTPKDGVFTDFRVASVRNPSTQQEIREIVPDTVLTLVESEARTRFGNLKSDNDKEAYQFIIARFPEWTLLKQGERLTGP